MTVMKNYRVRVETYDGCVTVWYEKSKAQRACDLIANRVYNQLCGLNIKEINVDPSVQGEMMISVPNWAHNSGKKKKQKGCCKGVIKARRQVLQNLKAKLQPTEDKGNSNVR